MYIVAAGREVGTYSYNDQMNYCNLAIVIMRDDSGGQLSRELQTSNCSEIFTQASSSRSLLSLAFTSTKNKLCTIFQRNFEGVPFFGGVTHQET